MLGDRAALGHSRPDRAALTILEGVWGWRQKLPNQSSHWHSVCSGREQSMVGKEGADLARGQPRSLHPGSGQRLFQGHAWCCCLAPRVPPEQEPTGSWTPVEKEQPLPSRGSSVGLRGPRGHQVPPSLLCPQTQHHIRSVSLWSRPLDPGKIKQEAKAVGAQKQEESTMHGALLPLPQSSYRTLWAARACSQAKKPWASPTVAECSPTQLPLICPTGRGCVIY